MSKQVSLVAKGDNFKAVDVGPWAELGGYAAGEFKGKVFLKDVLGATGFELSFGLLPPDTQLPFFHAHKQNEELYVVLRGKGQMQIDGEVFDLQEGSVVRVSPKGARSLKSAKDSEMAFMVVQTKAGSLEQWTGEDGLPAQAQAKWTK